jgi:hypothetical protein
MIVYPTGYILKYQMAIIGKSEKDNTKSLVISSNRPI